MEIKEDELNNIAGGKVIETKDGKFIVVPDFTKVFDTKEEAEKLETFLKQRKKPGKPHMPGPKPGFPHKKPTKELK